MDQSKSHVNVTVYVSKLSKKEDMRIPVNLSIYRLVKEIHYLFGEKQLMNKYQIKVKNKSLLLDDDKKLSDYPVTDGDFIEIMEGD